MWITLLIWVFTIGDGWSKTVSFHTCIDLNVGKFRLLDQSMAILSALYIGRRVMQILNCNWGRQIKRTSTLASCSTSGCSSTRFCWASLLAPHSFPLLHFWSFGVQIRSQAGSSSRSLTSTPILVPQATILVRPPCSVPGQALLGSVFQ